jgi:hypothetical protein
MESILNESVQLKSSSVIDRSLFVPDSPSLYGRVAAAVRDLHARLQAVARRGECERRLRTLAVQHDSVEPGVSSSHSISGFATASYQPSGSED